MRREQKRERNGERCVEKNTPQPARDMANHGKWVLNRKKKEFCQIAKELDVVAEQKCTWPSFSFSSLDARLIRSGFRPKPFQLSDPVIRLK